MSTEPSFFKKDREGVCCKNGDIPGLFGPGKGRKNHISLRGAFFPNTLPRDRCTDDLKIARQDVDTQFPWRMGFLKKTRQCHDIIQEASCTRLFLSLKKIFKKMDLSSLLST
jgi:hypothetical protein